MMGNNGQVKIKPGISSHIFFSPEEAEHFGMHRFMLRTLYT